MRNADLIEAYTDTEKYPSIKSIASFFGVGTTTVKRRLKKLRENGELEFYRSGTDSSNAPHPDSVAQIAKLKHQVSTLTGKLRTAESQIVSADYLKSLIHGLGENESPPRFSQEPSWLKPAKHKKGTRGVPVLLLGDLHYDEVVDPAQVAYVNEYNRDVADKRIRNTFQKARALFLDYTVKPQYPGIVVMLLGDIFAGNIHEELRTTNEHPIFTSILSLIDTFFKGIKSYADVFGRVFVPCVVGNHGRIDRKPSHKNKVYDNYDWMFYQFLAKMFSDDDRVTFYIPDSPDAYFNIYDFRFLVTHGDQFKGGSGIQGHMLPLTLGHHRKQKKHAAIGKPFDIMVCGHFHQKLMTSQIIVNGSTKGYDEFANNLNLPYERPQQLAFVVHKHNGIIHDTPVLCDSYEGGHKEKDFAKKEVISF